jgi:hypothetical protein
MKWLEVIKLRSAGKDSAPLDELLMSMTKMAHPGPAVVKVFLHAVLEGDLSVHLYWDSERLEQNGSALGIRLAQALKEFGLIDHSVWIEEEK